MKYTFINFLFGFLLLTNPSLVFPLTFDSYYPITAIEVRGSAAGDQLGVSVSSVGDIDNDGYDDLIIGAPNKDWGRGVAYVVYGGPGLNTQQMIDLAISTTLDPATTGFTIFGREGGSRFGCSVSSAGDFDNDQYDDIIIGASYAGSATNPGVAYVIYGGPKSSRINIDLSLTSLDPATQGFLIKGKASTESFQFGGAVSSAGDVDNDQHDDLMIGAIGKGWDRGGVYVIYGGVRPTAAILDLETTALVPSTTGFLIKGDNMLDEFGASLSSAGDINNDGFDDMVIGAYLKNYGINQNQGVVYVFYGGPRNTMSDFPISSQPLNSLSTGFFIIGNAKDDAFGWSVSRAGDINKDDYADIIIGAPGKDSERGAAYVIYGGEKNNMPNIDLSTTALNPATTGFMLTGSTAGDLFGFSVGCAGHINKNQYDDIIIGAPGKDSEQGAAYVVYGGENSIMMNIGLSAGALDPLTTGFMVSGNAAGDQFGWSVDGAVDPNGDGIGDLIIGAPFTSSNTGAAYVVLNKCSSNCKTCSSSSVCLTCLPRYFVMNSVCENCPSNCETCSSVTSCDICTVPYLLYNEVCLTSCPAKTFVLNGVKCKDCPEGCSECTSSSVCQACVDGYTLSESQCIKDKNSQKVAAGALEGASLAGAALGSGSSLPMNFGLVAKIIRNFKYMKLPVSEELFEAFVSWKVASGFLSAPKSWSGKYSSRDLPRVFSRYTLQAAFLINFWKPLVMALIGLAVFGVFKLIEASMSNDKKSMVYRISRQVNVAASNFALTQFYSNLDDVVFYFILEMRSTEFETGFRVASSLLAILLLLVGVIFVVLHWRFIAKYQKVKEGAQLKGFEYQWENINLIFKDFRNTNTVVQSFLMVNVIRSVISNIIFATLFEYPMIQIALLFVLNILMIVYIWTKMSFKEFTSACGQLFCEGVLFVANICVFILAMFEHTESYPISPIKGLGQCIIILNYILLFGCAILLLVSLGKMLYQSYMEKNKAQPQEISQPPIFASAKFTRPEPDLDYSLSTNSGFINETQNDTSKNGTLIQKMGFQQGVSIKELSQNRQRRRNPTNDFEKLQSHVLPQSNSSEAFREERSQASIFSVPRSKLMRNREITKARIAQFSENSRYNNGNQSGFQDSGIGLNYDEMGNQDLSIASFEMETPQRGNDSIQRNPHDDNGMVKMTR